MKVFHPILLALFPIVFLLSQNVGEIMPVQTIVPSTISLLMTSIIWGIHHAMFRKAYPSGAATSLFLILFYSYGHIHDALMGLDSITFTLYGNEIMLSIWTMTYLMGLLFLSRMPKAWPTMTRALNIISIILLITPGVSIANHWITSRPYQSSEDTVILTEPERHLPIKEKSQLPDMYYIILDGYARADVLRELYGYDNTTFIDYLKNMGFYVAERSSANYCQTPLSLGSSLNLAYLDELVERIGDETFDREPVINTIRTSRVFQIIQKQGYTIHAFASGYYATELKDVDHYISRIGLLDEFQLVLLKTTLIQGILDLLSDYIIYADLHYIHGQRIKYIVGQLTLMDLNNEKPDFVFAHIMSPHPPFIFDRDGDYIFDPEKRFCFYDGSEYFRAHRLYSHNQYPRDYLNQLIYITDQVRPVVSAILEKYPDNHKPVIILQSDHGPGSRLNWERPEQTHFVERFSILNAIYVPDGLDPGFYPEITPVNTYRLIFNHYLGTDYDRLPDRSWFSNTLKPYKFMDVTSRLNPAVESKSDIDREPS